MGQLKGTYPWLTLGQIVAVEGQIQKAHDTLQAVPGGFTDATQPGVWNYGVATSKFTPEQMKSVAGALAGFRLMTTLIWTQLGVNFDLTVLYGYLGIKPDGSGISANGPEAFMNDVLVNVFGDAPSPDLGLACS